MEIPEIIHNILKYVSSDDLPNCREVSKTFLLEANYTIKARTDEINCDKYVENYRNQILHDIKILYNMTETPSRLFTNITIDMWSLEQYIQVETEVNLNVHLKDFLIWLMENCNKISNSKECIIRLINAGIDPNTDNGTDTILMLACEHFINDNDIIKLILGKGAKTNIFNSENETALTIASKYGDMETVQLLLDAEASLNFQYDHCKTALMSACWHSDQTSSIEMVKLLIGAGSIVNLQDKDGDTALTGMCKDCDESHYDIIKLLIEADSDVNLLNNNKESALSLAIRSKHKTDKIIRLLIDSGADVDWKNIRRRGSGTTVTLAIQGRKVEALKMLTDAGADVNQLSSNHAIPPLVLAIREENMEIIRILLDANADTDMLYLNKTPLMLAIHNYHWEIAEMIINAGADVNTQNEWGSTALNLAITCDLRTEKIIRMLINVGADVNLKNKKGQTFLELAVESYPEIIGMIINAGFNMKDKSVYRCLISAIKKDEMETVKLLIEAGSNINDKDGFGETPLMTAVRYNRPKIVHYLIGNKAKLDLKNQMGETALMISISISEELIRILVLAGAKLNLQNKEGFTALILAVNNRDLKAVHLLVDLGANTKTKNKNGWTALMLACRQGDTDNPPSEIVEFLLKY